MSEYGLYSLGEEVGVELGDVRARRARVVGDGAVTLDMYSVMEKEAALDSRRDCSSSEPGDMLMAKLRGNGYKKVP